MSDRDDLAEICADSFSGADRAYGEHYKLVDKIIAAGFHRDRTITTAEELDALGDGAVIHAVHTGDVWQKCDCGEWVPIGVDDSEDAEWINETSGPFTVLHEGARDE
jgi:hypothetical protein